jgi:putative membrane protein
MIQKEKSRHRRFWSFIIFSLSGILGLIVLNFPNLNDPLLPMLSGLFGLCMLFDSLATNSIIPYQRITEHIEVKKSTTLKSLGAGTFAGSLTGFFPGLGASQASIIGSILVGGMETIGVYGFLILQGAINTINFLLSLVTLYTINKARNGAVISVMKIFPELTLESFIVILVGVLITAGIATYLAMWFARLFSKIMSKLNYKWVCWCIIILIIAMSFYFSGIIGLLVLFTSTMLGFATLKLGIAKNHAMGCLLLPIILYFIL